MTPVTDTTLPFASSSNAKVLSSLIGRLFLKMPFGRSLKSVSAEPIRPHRRHAWIFIAASLSFIEITAPALAADPRLLGTSGDWSAYSLNNGGTQSCFVSSAPKSRQPEGLKRDAGNLFVTYHSAGNRPPEIAISLGFPVQTGVAHSLQITGQSFSLYGQGENAWPQNDGDANKIIDLMKGGQQALVLSISGRGNRNTDSYSLSGFTSAWATAARTCR